MVEAASIKRRADGPTATRPTLLLVGLLTICGVLGLAATAVAQAPARTTVSIRAQGVDLSGYVSSSNPQRCANNRVVTVYRQRGRRQNRRIDARIGSDNASLTGNRYQWSTGNTGISGRFYAYARRIRGCRADFSRTILARR